MRPPPSSTLFPYTTLFRSRSISAQAHDAPDRAPLLRLDRHEVDAGADATSGPFDHVRPRSEEHTSELQSQSNLVCRLLLEKKQVALDRPLRSDYLEHLG